MEKFKIKKLKGDLPDIGHSQDGSAGIDLRASGNWVVDLDSDRKDIEQENYELKPGERILIKTGIKMAIPKGYWGNIRDRSGLAMKHGLHIMAGVVDENYRGEIGVVMVNLGKSKYRLEKNDKIAQMVITPCLTADISFEEELDESNRGENGFGSSGR